MEKITIPESAHTDPLGAPDAPSANDGLPNRLLKAFEVAEFVGLGGHPKPAINRHLKTGN